MRSVLGLCLCLALAHSSFGDLGVVLLDEIIFDKVVDRFPVALVKFDAAFPYGDKHDEYARFAKEQNVLVKDLLIADVHTKDYGNKENWSLLKRFGIDEKELPTILLLKSADPAKWLKYPRDRDVTVALLKNFVRQNTKLYIGLSGCIEEFDQFASQFMETFNRNEDMDRIITKATNSLAQMTDTKVSGPRDYRTREYNKFPPPKYIAQDIQQATVYLQIMKRIREKGISFKDDEKVRVSKLLSTTKLTPQKKKELEDRLNVLLSFRDATSGSGEKSEL